MNIQDIRSLQQQLEQAITQFKQNLAEQAKSPALDGVKVCGPRTAIVSFSTLIDSKNLCLSADYYIPEVQDEAVRYNILNPKFSTVDQLLQSLRAMQQTGQAEYKNGHIGSKTIVYLNSNTLKMIETLIEDFFTETPPVNTIA